MNVEDIIYCDIVSIKSDANTLGKNSDTFSLHEIGGSTFDYNEIEDEWQDGFVIKIIKSEINIIKSEKYEKYN